MKYFFPCVTLSVCAVLSVLSGSLSAQTAPCPLTVSVDSQNSGYEAYRACDDSESTMWHTEFSSRIAPMPHWLELDLQQSLSIEGIMYTPRQDGNHNGWFGKTVIYVFDNPSSPGEPVWKGDFSPLYSAENKTVQIKFDSPVSGRYVRVEVISSQNGQGYASAAEIQPIVSGKTFIDPRAPRYYANAEKNQELVQQYNEIVADIAHGSKYKAIENQIYDIQSAILPSDKNPADVIYRRTKSAAENLLKLSPNDSRITALLQSLNSLNPAQTPSASLEDAFAQFEQIAAIRKRILFAHPALDFDKILFAKKHRSTFNHLCDQYYGINLVPGGGVFLLENAFNPESAPTAKNVLENSIVQSGRLQGKTLDSGAFATLALNFSADKIAFGYVECQGARNHKVHTDLSEGHWERGRCLHVFTANADGSDLQQITDGTWNDFYPCFLPNGRLAFISERRGGYLRCGRECPNFTVFDMNPDGTQMRCLSYHETNEWAPSVSNDGKIIWTRWDYIDRFGCTAHHPWVMSLNGSDPRQIHGNFTHRRNRADTEMDVRAIPHSSKLIATAGPHHGQNYGSLIIIDPAQADKEETDDMACVKRLTPSVAFPESQGGAQVWGFPYPITEDLYLAVADFSMQPDAGMQWQAPNKGNYGLYLLDRFGNRELLYRDDSIGCASPIPFRQTKMPVVMPELVEPGTIPPQEYIALPPRDVQARPQATVTLANVYQSLKPLPENTKIKSLRIVQLYAMSVPSGWAFHTGYQEPSSPDSVNLVRGVIGTVPVESDGSAHFTVPAQVELFFQALDENGQTVQSMRSGTYFQPGDNVSCVGCHEPKGQITRTSSALPEAFKRPASVPAPDVVGSRPANFPELIQPILDKHCVECHAKPESKTFSLAKEPYAFRYNRNFYQSYNNLMKNGFGFYSYGNPLVTNPGQFGALKSPLLPLLDKGHYGVQLTPEERHSFVLWLDMLSPFYSVYEPDLQEKQLHGEKVYPTLE